MKNILVSVILLGCLPFFAACGGEKDDGSRAFYAEATIMGDSVDGYRCYLDGGGLVISFSPWLAKTERGYFCFAYQEEDWEQSDEGRMFIRNAAVYEMVGYEVIHPLSREEAEKKGVLTGGGLWPDSVSLVLDNAFGGYMDLESGFSTLNEVSGEEIDGEVNLVYDPVCQEADTLRMQLRYQQNVPDSWKNRRMLYRTVSCDISSLASLRQWNDSLTVVIDAGGKKWSRKMAKTDFVKPEGKNNSNIYYDFGK